MYKYTTKSLRRNNLLTSKVKVLDEISQWKDITASRFYQATHTSPHTPSISFLRAVCYPESVKFTTAATKYGCEHVKDAVKQYIEYMQGDHNEFSVTPAGLVVSTLKPMYGASPNSFTECSCCGAGVLEVKCPYCVQHTSLEDEVEKSSFCLKKLFNGALKLKLDHQYFISVNFS